jgi:5-methylcytosine-specific restriction endonuclease McrA
MKLSTQSTKSKYKKRCKGYDEWTKRCREEYKHTCFLCGDKESELHSHHILPYYKYKEYRIDDCNAVLMCKKCHMTFHELYGFLNNSLEQLLEYFKRNKAPQSKLEFLKNKLEGKVIIQRRRIVRRINVVRIVKFL